MKTKKTIKARLKSLQKTANNDLMDWGRTEIGYEKLAKISVLKWVLK